MALKEKSEELGERLKHSDVTHNLYHKLAEAIPEKVFEEEKMYSDPDRIFEEHPEEANLLSDDSRVLWNFHKDTHGTAAREKRETSEPLYTGDQ